MKQDIENRDDIVSLLKMFYQKAQTDDVIGSKFIGIDMHQHIEVIADFWDSILFGANTYKGDPFGKHIPLDLHQTDFDRWVQLFTETVDANYEGTVAEEAKMRGRTISKIFQHKLSTLR